MVAKIKSRTELILDVRASLGEPIIKVNVTDDQISRCIDYALKEYWKYHRDGSVEAFVTYAVTDEDITNGYIPIPDVIDSVVEVLPKGYANNFSNFATVEWQMAASAMSNVSGQSYSPNSGNPGGTYNGNTYLTRGGYGQIGMADWVLARQSIDTMRQLTGADTKPFFYDKVRKRLTPLFRFGAGEVICMRVYENTDPDTNPDCIDAYDDEWMKGLVVAQTKVAWGGILRKYGGVALPGGAILDGQVLVDEGNNEVKELMDFIRNERPIGFFIG